MMFCAAILEPAASLSSATASRAVTSTCTPTKYCGLPSAPSTGARWNMFLRQAVKFDLSAARLREATRHPHGAARTRTADRI